MANSSFYVTLNSQANQIEFPDNKPHRFKNQLHHPLILREPGWKVGLSSICLPAAQPNVRKNVLPEQGNKHLFNWSFWIDELIELINSRKYTEESGNLKRMLQDILKAGVQGGLAGLRSSRSFSDLRRNPKKGFQQGIKRKAKQAIGREITKRARDIFGV